MKINYLNIFLYFTCFQLILTLKNNLIENICKIKHKTKEIIPFLEQQEQLKQELEQQQGKEQEEQENINNNFKIGIVTYSTSNLYNYSSYSLAINSLYCYNSNYKFKIYNDLNGQYEKTDERWNKIKILEISLLTWGKSYDYIVWIDADAIVINYNFRFEDIILKYINASIIASSESFEILISDLFTSGGSVNKLNTGLLIVKNNKWSLKFLSNLWNYQNRTKYTDQTIFDMLTTEMSKSNKSDIKSNIIILESYMLNSNSPVMLWYENNHPIIHLLGEHSDYRQVVFERILQQICHEVTINKISLNNINSSLLKINSSILREWYLEKSHQSLLDIMNVLTIYTEKILPSLKLNSAKQIEEEIEKLSIIKYMKILIHLSTRITGALVFTSSSSSSSTTTTTTLQPIKSLSSLQVSYNTGNLVLRKSYRILNELVLNLRKINEKYNYYKNGLNLTDWYTYLSLTSQLNEFLCSIPSERKFKNTLENSISLYQELISFPTHLLSSDTTLIDGIHANHYRGYSLLLFYKLTDLKNYNHHNHNHNHNENNNNRKLKIEIYKNYLKSYQIYHSYSVIYGEQSLWILESMIGIILCELHYYIKCDLYFNKLINDFQSDGKTENNLFYGILLLKYMKYHNLYYVDNEENHKLWCIAYKNIMGHIETISECLTKNNNNNNITTLEQIDEIVSKKGRIPHTHPLFIEMIKIRNDIVLNKNQRKSQLYWEEDIVYDDIEEVL